MLRIYFILCLAILFSSLGHARQSCDWPFRTSINIQENSGTNLSDYQVQLTLNSSSLDSRYNWSSDGVDLRVYDSNDSTPLEFWVEDWDQSSNTATVWVRFPMLAANSSRNIFLYYGNSSAPPLANVPFTFVEPGIKFHTRNTTQDPFSYDNAQAIFNSGNDNVNGYGCTFITNFTSITNNQFFGSRNNFIAFSETYFEVKNGEQGRWEFRYGADFGWGGGLYVDNDPLEEQWNDDLWWGGNGNPSNWDRASEVLQGQKTLQAGYHKLEIIGGEPGADGGITVQYRKPGGNWTTFSTSTIDIRSRACPVAEPTITFGEHDVCGIDLEQLTTSPTSNTWPVNAIRSVSFRVTNNDAASQTANPNTRTTIILPNALVLNDTSGDNWVCSGSSTIQCDYNQPLNNSEPSSSILTITVAASNATEGSSTSITATVNGIELDSDLSNNSQIINITFSEDLGVPAACASPKPGLLARFFDISSYSDINIDNASDFQNLVNARATRTYLMGQTIISRINKGSNSSGNLFDIGSNERFLMILEGYIYSPTTRDSNYFGIDGDDAVEVRINGNVASAFYGLHGAANRARGTGTLTSLPKGFTPLEFRLQENTGADAYFLYWSSSQFFGYQIIPAANYFHCAGDPDIQLDASLQVISDPINTSNFKAIPGAEIRHSVNAQNLGNISTDINSTSLVQAIDEQNQMFVGNLSSGSPIIFNDGSGNNASGLSYTFTSLTSNSDSLSFSTDGTDFNYSPIPNAEGYDPNVTHFRLTLGGTFKPTLSGVTPNFNFIYQVKVD